MKYVFSFVMMMMSTAAFAMPADTSALIQALVQIQDFQTVVANQSGMNSLSVTRVMDKAAFEVRRECGYLSSKSASVLKLTFTTDGGPQVKYFKTSDHPKDLTLCVLE